jgi:hypothetical protein
MVAKSGYGYKNNKTIDKKNVPMFREIPCNKNIYYANALIKLNNFDYKETNIFGAIILKWLRNNKISFINKEVGIFNKETTVIDLTKNPVFDNEPVLSIRGWGYLTGIGGLRLDVNTAAQLQDQFGDYIVEQLNKNIE